MVGGEHHEGPIRQDRVEVVTGDGFVERNDRIVGRKTHQQRFVRVGGGIVLHGLLQWLETLDAVQVELAQRNRAGEDVHVGFVEAWQHRGALCVDHFRRRPGKRRDLVVRADGKDAVAGDGDGLGPGGGLVHGQNAGVADDEVGGLGHGVSPA